MILNALHSCVIVVVVIVGTNFYLCFIEILVGWSQFCISGCRAPKSHAFGVRHTQFNPCTCSHATLTYIFTYTLVDEIDGSIYGWVKDRWTGQ